MSRYTEPLLLSGGDYEAIVERIDAPVAQNGNHFMERVSFRLRVEGQLFSAHYIGYYATARLIYRMRKVWLGTKVTARVRICTHDGEEYNNATIVWPDEEAEMTKTEWKPQPGKPAMTRDGKKLVLDLKWVHNSVFSSDKLKRCWDAKGKAHSGVWDDNLTEPTAALLAQHGVDAMGKAVTPPWSYISTSKFVELMKMIHRQPYGTPIAIEHDGFKGVVIGWYVRLDGVTGIVAQLDDARVVHVYGEKWLKPAPEVAKGEGR